MGDMEVDEVKQQNTPNSLLKNKDKTKDPSGEETVVKSKRVVFQDKPIILNKAGSKTDGISTKTDTNENEKNRDKRERVRPPSKVVVRRLPPTMTLETFIDHVSPLPEHDYIYFVKADLSLGVNSFSRAYINFVNITDLLTFYEQFDNYVFMDNKGNEYPAVVEFAHFQRVPKKRLARKKDPKSGTLKDDPAYIAFVQSLREKKDAGANKQTSAEHLLALTTEGSSKKEVTTPLLEFLKQRRAERQRIRDEKKEERRRKELERKRIKEEERRRRKEGDSASHEEKDESGRGNKDRPQSNVRKRDDDRQRMRDKDKKDGRQIPEHRQRDSKGRGDGGSKSYREDRQKHIDGRMQRKPIDDTRKKPGMGPNKLSDTRRSQEFDRKDADSRRKDGEDKKPYGYQGDRKNYRDGDNKRSQGYDRRKSGYSGDRKFSGRGNDYKIQKSAKAEEEKWELLGAKPKTKAVAEEKKAEEPPGFVLKRRNSAEHTDSPIASETLSKRRSSLESDVDKPSKEPKRQSSLDPEASITESTLEGSRKGIPLSKSQEFEKTVCSEVVHKRRGSLDSGDHDMEQRDGLEDCNAEDGGAGTDSDRKRDPRAERRIRNKDRPSIEIYRPGMGRFSMQRKEREKGPDQESPSTSPSPTPSGRPSKSSKELRSMTFKRSVSREK